MRRPFSLARSGHVKGVKSAEIAQDALTSVARQPLRTFLCALGTVVAVAAIVTTNGITHSAEGAVSSSFNLLRATTVEFQAPGVLLTDEGIDRLGRLNGVRSAGLLWDIQDGQPIAVATTPELASRAGEASNQLGTAELGFTAASPSALSTAGATVSAGRLYDDGADRQRQMVAVLGAAAARQLGISSIVGNPAVFVGGAALTVVGIVGATNQDSQLLLDVIVPPYVASVIGGKSSERRVIARTVPGAAQLIGDQGPYALVPYEPSEVAAEVPPDPSTLRVRVESSLSALLLVLAAVGIAIGFLSIASVTMLSVTQRRAEIGLRRALGYYRWDVARLVLTEGALIGILGGIMGASIGVLVTSAVAAASGWTPVLDPLATVLAPVLGIAVGVLAGGYPAVRAATITPLAALRSG